MVRVIICHQLNTKTNIISGSEVSRLSVAIQLWLHVLSQKNMTITWGYYFRTGIVMTLPVLFVTLAALALRLSFTL